MTANRPLLPLVIKKIDTYSGGSGSTQRLFFFENGYGASVIEMDGYYSSISDLQEIALIRGNVLAWEFDFTTNLAADVMRFDSEAKVQQFLRKIWRLPSCKSCSSNPSTLNTHEK